MFDAKQTNVITSVLKIVFGNILLSFALAENASTMGMDVLALIWCKYHPKTKLTDMMRYLNYFVIMLGFMTYGLKAVALGFIFSYLYTRLLNKLFERNKHHAFA